MEELFVIRCHSAFPRSAYVESERIKGVVAEQEQMFEVTVDNNDIDITVEEEDVPETEEMELGDVDEIIDCGIFPNKNLKDRCIFR